MDSDPLIQSQDDTKWAILRRSVIEHNSVRVYDLMAAHGVDAIIVKGAAALSHYPNGHLRDSVDIDVAVSSTDHAAAAVAAFSDGALGLAIDLHKELGHLDEIDWDILFKRSQMIDVSGGRIRVLAPEDHLRILAFHWLIDGGTSKERLWDIYYLLDKTRGTLDWDVVTDGVSGNRRRWLECVIGLTARALELDISDTPFSGAADRLPTWFIKAVETEWSRTVKHLPLESSIFKEGSLRDQILMRLNPNPIRATVEMNGSFDAPTRVFYQIGNFIMRIPSTVRRVTIAIRSS
jgi:hypothetical protein